MISRTTALIIAVIAFAVGMGVGTFGYITLTAGSGQASKPVSAATLLPVSTVVATKEATKVATKESTTEPTKAATQKPTVQAQAATAEATMAATMEAAVATEAPSVASASTSTYNIDKTQSEVRFILQEDLRGSRIDVVGITKEVAGQIRVDTAQPANSQVGQIVINARTLETDIGFRNQAIRGRILRSAEDAYEFITFTPTAITGLPTSAVTKGPLTFQVMGDLKIVEVTKSVTFDVTLDTISADKLVGSGKTTIKWADFNLAIPSVPGVANVTPDVTLEINFVATAAK